MFSTTVQYQQPETEENKDASSHYREWHPAAISLPRADQQLRLETSFVGEGHIQKHYIPWLVQQHAESPSTVGCHLSPHRAAPWWGPPRVIATAHVLASAGVTIATQLGSVRQVARLRTWLLMDTELSKERVTHQDIVALTLTVLEEKRADVCFP